MKSGYLVQVKIPVQVFVEIDLPCDDWRGEYTAANRAAIQQVIAGVDDETMQEAIKILNEDGLMYPDDFAEVSEIVQ